MASPAKYVIYGVNQSFFTRKLTGYLDYKDIPWRLVHFIGGDAEVHRAGWTGGIPAVRTPDGEFIWDTTAMILHIEGLHPEPSVLPQDPTLQFLCFLLEDFSDEWLYRPAVGTRWLYEENRTHGSWDLGRDASVDLPVSADQARAMVTGAMQASIHRLGATAENIESWVGEVLKPWQKTLSEHLSTTPFLLGDRPCLADFAVFGANAAHFINDPLCRRWTDELAPEVVRHTHRLYAPEDQTFGNWLEADTLPDSLMAVLAELGGLYLPWVARATREGEAKVEFASGSSAQVASTPFLDDARSVLLARYAAARCEALDEVLERAGLLKWLEPYLDQAGEIPSFDAPPRPALNQPYPATPA